MFKEEIKKSIESATQLVNNVIEGDITITEFIQKYDNFYYVEALDGHEANDECKRALDELSSEIELHRIVQCDIVDKVDLNEQYSAEERQAACRITPSEAYEKLQLLVSKS